MGKILLEGKNLRTEAIQVDKRDEAIVDFCGMHCSATMVHDEFFALEELYGDADAPIYRYFCPWSDFIREMYGDGVSFNAWQMLRQIFVSCPNLHSVASADEFFRKEKPLAEGGFRSPESDSGLLVDKASWRKWRENWFCAHQELVNWGWRWQDCFFINNDIVEEILDRENKKFIKYELNRSGYEEITNDMIDRFFNGKAECHIDEDVTKGLKDNAAAIFFHSFVMRSYPRGGERQGYACSIGSEICESNYYRRLVDLTSMERKAAPAGCDNTQRTIYGIVNSEGKWKFISIDYEKGMFEFYNDAGEHLGEFRFDGSRNAGKQADHNLRCVDEWRRNRIH